METPQLSPDTVAPTTPRDDERIIEVSTIPSQGLKRRVSTQSQEKRMKLDQSKPSVILKIPAQKTTVRLNGWRPPSYPYSQPVPTQPAPVPMRRSMTQPMNTTSFQPPYDTFTFDRRFAPLPTPPNSAAADIISRPCSANNLPRFPPAFDGSIPNHQPISRHTSQLNNFPPQYAQRLPTPPIPSQRPPPQKPSMTSSHTSNPILHAVHQSTDTQAQSVLALQASIGHLSKAGNAIRQELRIMTTERDALTKALEEANKLVGFEKHKRDVVERNHWTATEANRMAMMRVMALEREVTYLRRIPGKEAHLEQRLHETSQTISTRHSASTTLQTQFSELVQQKKQIAQDADQCRGVLKAETSKREVMEKDLRESRKEVELLQEELTRLRREKKETGLTGGQLLYIKNIKGEESVS